MNGKIIISMMITFLFLSGSISVAQQQVIPKNIDESREFENKYINIKNGNNNTTYDFATFGPKAFTISKITVQNGTFKNQSLFWLNLLLTIGVRLQLLLFPLVRPNVWFTFDDSPVDFTIEYKKDAPLGMLSRHRYFTYITETNNGTFSNSTEIWNEKHTVKVKGFYGVYMETKRSILMAPSFIIVGICENLTLIQ